MEILCVLLRGVVGVHAVSLTNGGQEQSLSQCPSTGALRRCHIASLFLLVVVRCSLSSTSIVPRPLLVVLLVVPRPTLAPVAGLVRCVISLPG